MNTNTRLLGVTGLLAVVLLTTSAAVRAQGPAPAQAAGYRLLSGLVGLIDQAGRGTADTPTVNAGLLGLSKQLRDAADATQVDPIFAVRFSRLLSALRQALLADPGMLYWPMYRASMIDFIEERTGRPLEWNALLSAVGDHGGSGVGLALLIEPVMSEVVSLHIHLETLDRRQAVLESYMNRASTARQPER